VAGTVSCVPCVAQGVCSVVCFLPELALGAGTPGCCRCLGCGAACPLAGSFPGAVWWHWQQRALT
jgi:hypothetical protein